jgi:DNA processing protein
MGQQLNARGGACQPVVWRGGEALWWAAMHQVEGIGAATMLRLARLFGSPAGALEASAADLMSRAGLSQAQAQQMQAARGCLPALRDSLISMAKQGITLCALGDPLYPPGLLDLRSPPPLLYLRGELKADDERAVAVVGTREPTREGTRTARWLAQQLAERGFTIVSGLARGIDTAAHRGALAAGQGRTIAVLGCGLLRVYPPENGVLAAKIARRGCLVGEIPPDREVERRLLLARDRIQAALARAVIVVQAHPECGSMVTARHAVKCKRLLFAVPWEEASFSAGWHELRRLGARTIAAKADLDALAAEIDRAAQTPIQQPLT